MRKYFRWLAILGLLWLFGLVLAVIYFWPWSGGQDWLWFVVVGPPVALLLQLLGEWYGAWWQTTPIAQAVQDRTRHKRFSWLRIATALLSTALFLAILGILLVWLS